MKNKKNDKTTRSTTRMVAAMLPAVLAVACAAEGLQTPPACMDSLDCPQDEYCDPASNTCQPVSKPQSVVDFELIPTKGSGSATTQIPGQDLAALKNPSDLQLEVADAVAVSGQFLSVMGGIPGNLVASRHPQIDDRRLVWNIAVSEDGNFLGELSPGTYDLVFKPSNRESFPRFQLLDLEIAPGEPGELPLPDPRDFQDYDPDKFTEDFLANQDPLQVIRGQVLESEEYPHPRPGVKVEGMTADGLRTNLVEPDDQGVFYLLLPVASRLDDRGELVYEYPLQLDIVIRPKDSSVRLPTVTTPDVELTGADLGVFYLGDIPPSVSYAGVVVDTASRPVAGCQLRLEADAIGNGSLSHLIESDDTGHFATTLPQGTYRIQAVPPQTSDARITTTTVEIRDDNDTATIHLSAKRTLAGVVRDADGHLVPEIIVRAKRQRGVGGFDDGIQRTYETVTGPEGTYRVKVDSGTLDVTFVPPTPLGLPRTLPQRVYLLDEDVGLDATLPAPAVVQGHVFNQSGEPMCGVTVDVYHSTEAEAFLIGQALSTGTDGGCTGSYSVTIPASLLSETE